MNPLSDRASAIFLAMAGIAPDARGAWLDAQCGADDALRSEVAGLVASLEADEWPGPLDVTLPDHARADAPVARAGTRVGEFTIVDVLGTGGAGVVYRAQQRSPARTVALKLLREGLESGAARKRFEVEADILGHLHHPGIAQVFAAHPGDALTPPFIAMELVDGPPLTDFVERHALALPARLELVARIADAIQHAHQRGVIHRDLKPANILVAADGQPKVVDFGVARATGVSLAHSTLHTEEGQLMGTLAYMSPEQVRASPDQIDTRTDVYSLGVILFRVLAGRLPFADRDVSMPELARRIVDDDPPRLTTIDGAPSGDLGTVVARALAKDRDRRYGSAADLATDLRRCIDGQPIAARADSAWYVLRTRAARYRTALAASMAVLVLVAAAAAYATLQHRRAQQLGRVLASALASSTIERGRLLSATGAVLAAEALVWPEAFRDPHSRQALWALWEIYARSPSLWARDVHAGGTRSVRFSPDGTRVLTAGSDGIVCLLDAATGAQRRAFRGHDGRVAAAVFGTDGHAISAGRDGTLRWLDLTGGATLARADTEAPLTSLTALPDSDDVVTADDSGRIRLWRAGMAGPTVTEIGARPVTARVVALDRAGARVVAGFDDGVVAAWSIDGRRQLWEVNAAPQVVGALAFHPDGHTLVSGGSDQVLRFHDATSGRVVRSLTPRNGSVRQASFDDAGRHLAVAGWWRTLVLDLSEQADSPRDVGIGQGAWDARLDRGGTTLATCDEQTGRVQVWRLGETAVVEERQAHDAGVAGLVAVPDGRVQTATRALLASADGAWIAAITDHGVDVRRHGGETTGLAVSADATGLAQSHAGLLVVGQADGVVSAWDVKAGSVARAWVTPPGSEVTAIGAVTDAIAVARRDRVLTLLDADTGDVRRRLDAVTSVFAIAADDARRRLLLGTWRGGILVVDADSGRSIRALDGHTRVVRGLAVDRTNGLLASASRDGSVRLWDLESGAGLATLARRDAGAEQVAFLPGTPVRLAVGYADGVVQTVDGGHFFRHVAGNAESSRALYGADPAAFPRAGELIAWSRRFLAEPAAHGLPVIP